MHTKISLDCEVVDFDADYEVNFLNMLSLVSNGAELIISKHGDSYNYRAHTIINNDNRELVFDCGLSRAISYYAEHLVLIALFGKTNLDITLNGITNDNIDPSIDSLAQALPAILEQFNLSAKHVQFKVLKRGFRPNGGGSVSLKVQKINSLDNCHWMKPGLVKRIRGTCYASKASVNIIGRVIGAARDIFNDYIPDVWIYSEYSKGNKGSLDPGYGITVVAETNTGSFISSDRCFSQFEVPEKNTPEALGSNAALTLLDEVLNAGVVDTTFQSFLLTLMALSGGKPSVALLGRISAYT